MKGLINIIDKNEIIMSYRNGKEIKTITRKIASDTKTNIKSPIPKESVEFRIILAFT